MSKQAPAQAHMRIDALAADEAVNTRPCLAFVLRRRR